MINNYNIDCHNLMIKACMYIIKLNKRKYFTFLIKNCAQNCCIFVEQNLQILCYIIFYRGLRNTTWNSGHFS